MEVCVVRIITVYENFRAGARKPEEIVPLVRYRQTRNGKSGTFYKRMERVCMVREGDWVHLNYCKVSVVNKV